jgi:uncharacterized protein (TIGR02300 family)
MSDLGNKYECFSCGAKFYDLGKPEPICPKCGANQREAANEAASQAKRRKREEVVRVAEVPEEDLVAPAADEDFADEEIEKPEGVRDEDQEPEAEEVDDDE